MQDEWKSKNWSHFQLRAAGGITQSADVYDIGIRPIYDGNYPYMLALHCGGSDNHQIKLTHDQARGLIEVLEQWLATGVLEPVKVK